MSGTADTPITEEDLAPPESLNVLVAAYDETTYNSVARILKRDTIRSSRAGNLEEAQAKIASGDFNVVLTDWTRGMGPGTIKAAKAQPGIHQIVVMNGGGPDVVDEADKMGVSTIEKPFPSIESLITAVRGNLSQIVHLKRD